MKIVFVSNFFNHHQEPFSLTLDDLTDHNYYFVASKKFPEERLKIGYNDMNKKHPFIIRSYESTKEKKQAQQIILEADAVIFGSAPRSLIRKRLCAKRLTFFYAERIYKEKSSKFIQFLKYIKHHFQFRTNKNTHLLCASAFTAADFTKSGSFINRTYKWGYFPPLQQYDNIDAVLHNKKPNSILWAGRLIDWKHPEYAIEVARRLKQENYSFELNIIGNGELFDKLQSQIAELQLDNEVRLLGSMPPDQVRTHMENAEVYLFTSDKNEGWGAVLNESMNSGCAVVASSAIGSVPFLVKDRLNGFIYKDGDVDDLYRKVKSLLDDKQTRQTLGKNAYKTLAEEWNAEIAAKRFISLVEELSIQKKANLFAEGPCSKAIKIKDDWYK